MLNGSLTREFANAVKVAYWANSNEQQNISKTRWPSEVATLLNVLTAEKRGFFPQIEALLNYYARLCIDLDSSSSMLEMFKKNLTDQIDESKAYPRALVLINSSEDNQLVLLSYYMVFCLLLLLYCVGRTVSTKHGVGVAFRGLLVSLSNNKTLLSTALTVMLPLQSLHQTDRFLEGWLYNVYRLVSDTYRMHFHASSSRLNFLTQSKSRYSSKLDHILKTGHYFADGRYFIYHILVKVILKQDVQTNFLKQQLGFLAPCPQ